METRIPIGPIANTPGEILRSEFLEPLGLSQNELANQSGLDRMRINEIVRGRRKITAKTAIALGRVLDIEPQFWLNLQRDYDLAVEAKKSRSLTARVRSVVASRVQKSESWEWARSAFAFRKARRAVDPDAARACDTLEEPKVGAPAHKKRSAKSSKK